MLSWVEHEAFITLGPVLSHTIVHKHSFGALDDYHKIKVFFL